MPCDLPPALSQSLRDYSQSSLQSLCARTRTIVLSRLQRFLGWLNCLERTEHITWIAVTPKIVNDFFNFRLNQPSRLGGRLSTKTITRDLTPIRDWLAWNEMREGTGTSRSAYVAYLIDNMPHEEAPEVHIITPYLEQRILDRCHCIGRGDSQLRYPDFRYGRSEMHKATEVGWAKGAFALYFVLMMRQGLRPQEAIRLRWDELDLTSYPCVLRLRRLNDERGVPIRKLKTAKSQDAITLGRAVYKQDRDQWSGICDGLDVAILLRDFQQHARGPWVFGNELGQFPNEYGIWRALKHEMQEPDLRAYSCRHTLATRMAARGFTLEQIARVLRNTVASCEKYYVAGTRTHDAFDVMTGQRVQVERQRSPSASSRMLSS